jgi:hypothetical protein
MWGNSFWGLLGFSVTFALAVLLLSPEHELLRPWLIGASILCGVISATVLCWPLRHKQNRDKVREAFKHPRKWAASTLEPIHIIILALAIALAAALWQWRRTIPPDPQIISLQSKVADLKQKLLDASKPVTPGSEQSEVSNLKQKLAESQQELARRQAVVSDITQQRDTARQELTALQQKVTPPSIPIDPRAPPPPRNPYQDGPLLQRTYVDDEPKRMINALRELSELAMAMQQDINIPTELTMWRRGNISNPSQPQNWAQVIVRDGVDKEVDQLNELAAKAKDYAERLMKIIGQQTYAYFAADLYRIVGQPGLQELGNTANGYVYYLQLLKRKNIPVTNENVDIITPLLTEVVKSFEKAGVDYRYWNSTFVSQRAPAAREQLEKFIPRQLQ